MEAFPLRIQERVQHLPPGPAVQHKGQAHNRCDGDKDGIHRQVFGVHSEYGQESDSSNYAAKDEKEDDKRGKTARFFPFLFTCKYDKRFLTTIYILSV